MAHQARHAALVLALVSMFAVSSVRTAHATASCSGNQTNSDVDTDQCQTISQQGGTATANASGPVASFAGAEAVGSTSTATSTAIDDASATATAEINSTATASAMDDAVADAFAEDSSTATTTSSDDSLGEAIAEGNANATVDVSDGSEGVAEALDGGLADADATDGGEAGAAAVDGAISVAIGTAGGEAISENATPGTTVCTFAALGGFAQGSDTQAPFCEPGTGGVAVVVSPLGSCGPVADSPCAPVANGDSIVRLINPNGGANIGLPSEEHPVCAMIYVFDTDQEMQACCGCPISSTGMLSLSATRDLRADIIGSDQPDATLGYVDVVPSDANASAGIGEGCIAGQTGACNGGCDPTSQPGYQLSSDATLFGTVSHSQIVESLNPEAPTLGVTELPLPIDRPRDPKNLTYLQTECGVLVGNGSGAGICHCPVEGAVR